MKRESKKRTNLLALAYFRNKSNLLHFIIIFILLMVSLTLIEKKWFGGKEGGGESSMWTCSMHPQIMLPTEGDCPICAMDLIPLGSGQLGADEIEFDSNKRRMAQITTVLAEKDFVKRSIRLSGKVEIDQTREGKIAARFPGRIERMFINYPGVSVRKGDHLYEIYSPEIYQAQLSLLRSKENADRARAGGNQTLLRTAKLTYQSSKEQLKLFGLTSSQIKELEKSGKARERITIYSPASGIVTKKMSKEGDYLKEGTVVYQISDLTQVWVVLDAYEKDIPWIRYGEKIELFFDGLPGEGFSARIAYIDPILNEETRTVKVRVNLENQDLLLKPGMFAEGSIEAILTSEGKFIEESLAGKYISPMHPEIIKEGPGKCDVCGVALVQAKKLGYVSASEVSKEKILIPKSAVLRTGKRAIVYVEEEVNGSFIYQAREVILGPETERVITVEKGLSEGERVVSEGVFKVDASMQILAKNSMMNREPTKAEISKIQWEGYEAFFDQYVEMNHKLALDDYAGGVEQLQGLKKIEFPLEKSPLFQAILDDLNVLSEAQEIKTMREKLRPLSGKIIELGLSIDGMSDEYGVFFCSMYTDDGSYWLDKGDKVQNPYYGSMMFACGEKSGSLDIFLPQGKVNQ